VVGGHGQSSNPNPTGDCGCVCLRRAQGTDGTDSVLNVDETEECLNYAPTVASSARELSSGVS